LIYFVAIWYILWPFGIFCVALAYFSPSRYVARRKIWQPFFRGYVKAYLHTRQTIFVSRDTVRPKFRPQKSLLLGRVVHTSLVRVRLFSAVAIWFIFIPKITIWVNFWGALRTENVGIFYGHFVYIRSLWTFGMVLGHLVHISFFGMSGQRNIWQPC
jgi:hypothetical protein